MSAADEHEELIRLARSCQACDLYRDATQVVFGEGPVPARLMLIGEQPGDREDIEGSPFVGPAGEVLDQACVAAGLDRSAAYVTNAVKHFKFERRGSGKVRVHKKPNAAEVRACRPWWESELALVHPAVLCCLGATAAQAVIGPTFRVTRDRGEFLRIDTTDADVIGTIHPSAVLRARGDREEVFAGLVEDLRRVAARARVSDAPRLRVGTSGWQYADWRGEVYPRGVAQRRWLERYATMFSTVEVNNSFYQLPAAATFERWKTMTPDSFCFAVKASRYLTHVRRLQEPAEPVGRLLGVARELGTKLGPVLLQLPPRFDCHVDRLDQTLDLFGDVPVAVELRDDRWQRDEVYEVLRRHAAALVWWDRRGAHDPLIQTADWCYLRMHQGRGRRRPSYGTTPLARWCEQIGQTFGSDARGWVYFNNDAGAAAPADAAAFVELARAHGLDAG